MNKEEKLELDSQSSESEGEENIETKSYEVRSSEHGSNGEVGGVNKPLCHIKSPPKMDFGNNKIKKRVVSPPPLRYNEIRYDKKVLK